MEHHEVTDINDTIELIVLKKEMQAIKAELDIITLKLDNITKLFENTKAVLTAIQWIGGTIAAVWAAFVAIKDHLEITVK